MADGLCTEDTVDKLIDKTLVKDYNGIVKCLDTNGVDDLTCEKVKSFYINSDSDKICDKMCGVKGSTGQHEGFLNVPCSVREDDCRKKRCADRYDSSESSDSGVAVLSCTDCSNYSGGSTASSDITDPGSPFSTASTHSEDSALQPPKMPPNLSAHHPPWPWSGGDSPPLKRSGVINKTASPKRLKTSTTEAASISTNTIDSPTQNNSKSLPSVKDTNSNTVLTISDQQTSLNIINKKNIKKSDTVFIGKVQQGKITEYFKSQMKTNGVKKDILLSKVNGDVTNRNKIDVKSESTINMQNILKLIDGQKVILNGKCTKLTPDLYKKIDLRTLNVVTPVKKVVLDTKTRKLISVPRKILPGPKSDKNKTPSTPSPTVKLTALRIQQDLKCITTKNVKTIDNLFINSATKLGNKITTIVKKNSNININNNNTNNAVIPVLQTQVTNLNLKVSSTVVPIVKLNNTPSKLNGSLLNNNLSTTLCVDTAVPTVPSAKPKNSTVSPVTECLLKPLSTSPTEKSTHQKHQPKSSNVETSQQKKFKIECSTKAESSKSTDSDSGVSVKEILSVSVTSTTKIEEQKSPILSQPKTIRFPAKQIHNTEQQNDQRKSDVSDSGLCRWSECEAQFDTSGALLEHLQIKHVISQATAEHYVCLWIGCKVHGRTSCSRSWLERHVLSHAGNKPFRCIVDGCGCRFNSQATLERHVNSHFNSSENGSNASTRKSLETGIPKLFKRNGKKLRYRRQPWSARMFDFFDAGIMEGLQHRLVTMTDKRTSGDVTKSGDTVTVRSNVVARRVEPDGTKKFLVQWHPQNIIADEWLLENEVTQTKTVSIPTLQPPAMNALKQTLFPKSESSTSQCSTRQKQRRKNVARSS